MPEQRSQQRFLADPGCFPSSYDAGRACFELRRADRVALSAAPFLDQRFTAARPVVGRLPLAGLLAPEPPTPPLYVFHTAFCCSTLLCRCLDHPGLCLTLKDSGLVMDLANALRTAGDPAGARRAREALIQGVRLLARPHSPGERVLIKPPNAAAVAHGPLLEAAPGSRAVLLFSSLRSFMVSILKKGEQGRAFVRTLYNIFTLDGTGLAAIPSRQAMTFTDMQVMALVWRHQMESYAGLLERYGRARLTVLDCERLLDDPAATLKLLRGRLVLDLPDAAIDATVAGEVLRRNAKFEGSDYDARARREEAAEVEAAWAADLDRIVGWAGNVVLDRPLRGDLAAY